MRGELCFRKARTLHLRDFAGAGWPASFVGLGAGAPRRHAQLQLPAHARNKTQGGLRRVRLGAAVIKGGTDAVIETSTTASTVHLPAMSPRRRRGLGLSCAVAPAFAGMMPASTSLVGA